MIDPEQRVVDAANHLAGLIEAAARGLKRRRHKVHLDRAQARVQKLIAEYFRRQGAFFMAAVKPHIRAGLAAYPPPLVESLREADSGEWVTINGHPVLIGGGAEATAARVERAKNSAVRTDKVSQDIAERSEVILAKALGIPKSGDNLAFDVRNDDIAIECKTLVNGKNERISMGPRALARKIAEQRAEGLKAYTVVVDRRAEYSSRIGRGAKVGDPLTGHATYYLREGLGSFHLSTMEKMTIAQIRERIKQ